MMRRKNTPILEILVDIRRDEIVEMTGPTGTVRMIPFGGTVKGPLFHGIVEPCGVDTQVTNLSAVRHMSARYMLTGEDCEGHAGHIYVENNAWFTDGARPQPFKTIPTFMTDSPALAPILHRGGIVGEGHREEEGLWIRYFETEEDAN